MGERERERERERESRDDKKKTKRPIVGICLTTRNITTGQFQHHLKVSAWPPYDVLRIARRLKTTNTNLFILLDYPSPYIYFIFNFDLSTLNCFKLAEFVLFCKAEQQKFLLIL
jgi:hypothetical protein